MQDEALRVEVANGLKAARELELLGPMFDEMHESLHGAIDGLSVTATEDLVNLKLQLHALKALRLKFNTLIESGKMASIQLEEIH